MGETLPPRNIQTANDQNFQKTVVDASKEKLILVDFWAPWCGPCRTLTPILEGLAQEYEGAFTLVKVNTDDSPALAQQFQIRSIPTVMAIQDGTVVEHFSGAQTRAYIDDLLKLSLIHILTLPTICSV